MDPEKRLTACAPRPQRWKRRQMRRRHVRSLHPAPAFAPAAPHSITACFAGSKHTMQASFPKRSLSCPDALDPACRAPAPERGENAHATGNVETRRPEPKTASDSPGMPKAAPLRCCAHGGSRGTGARWRLRSFIREDNAPQRRSFNTVARCRAGRNDSAGGHGRPAHRPEADGRPNRKRALTERRQTT